LTASTRPSTAIPWGPTLTTVLGLLPLAAGWGVGASLPASLARVVVGGLIASTLITLVLIPALYISATLVVEQAHERMRGWSWLPGRSGGAPTARPSAQ
jgi:HAE1 family hydrophobic/amphiphilic exporter-1